MLCPGSQEFDHWFGDNVDVASRVAWRMLSWCSEAKEEPGRVADGEQTSPPED